METYLGDGVYIKPDNSGTQQVLYTSNGAHETNTIFLEPEVIGNLLKYLATQYDVEKLVSCLNSR